MSQIRINFLNWRPDQEDFGNDGLSVADNLLHDIEGYKQVTRNTDTAAATISSFTDPVSLTSFRVSQLGSEMTAEQSSKMHFRLTNTSGTSANFLVEHSDQSPAEATTKSLVVSGGSTAKPMASGGAITAFDTCEMEDFVFAVAQAEGSGASGTALSANHTVYMTITSTAYLGQTLNEVTPNGLSCATVAQFVVIADADNPFDVRWCAVGDPSDWPVPDTDDARSKQAGRQTMINSFGQVMAIAGGDFFGYVFQERGITKMTYVGGDVVFTFDTFEESRGCFFRNRIVSVDDKVFFESAYGYHVVENDQVSDIGLGLVDDSHTPS